MHSPPENDMGAHTNMWPEGLGTQPSLVRNCPGSLCPALPPLHHTPKTLQTLVCLRKVGACARAGQACRTSRHSRQSLPHGWLWIFIRARLSDNPNNHRNSTLYPDARLKGGVRKQTR
eukprot:scaffold155232_cov14-Tisochrysis_lutea.AAC.1